MHLTRVAVRYIDCVSLRFISDKIDWALYVDQHNLVRKNRLIDSSFLAETLSAVRVHRRRQDSSAVNGAPFRVFDRRMQLNVAVRHLVYPRLDSPWGTRDPAPRFIFRDIVLDNANGQEPFVSHFSAFSLSLYFASRGNIAQHILSQQDEHCGARG